MRIKAPDTALAAANDRFQPVSSGGIPEADIICATQVPQNADSSCPNTKFRGCAKGDSMVPNIRIAEAPNDPTY
jgi:hypothetical protein